MADTRKPRNYGKHGTFQFRRFADAENPEKRQVTAQLKAAAKSSHADSLLRKFSWDDKAG